MLKRISLGGFLILFIIILISFGNLFAYSTSFTHPHLIRETAKLYNHFNSEFRLEDEGINRMVDGSKKEDTPPRYINHFYDPINNRPWLGENPIALTAKEWANDSKAQSAFVGGDQTFQRAIYEYREGNKKSAFIALGHLLHLIQDMSVPEHTRNDTHIPGTTTESPYEIWAEKHNQTHADSIAQNLIDENKSLSICFSLDNCFGEIARYSNGYFFSIDSVDDYELPKILKWEESYIKDRKKIQYGIGKDIDGLEFRLVSQGQTNWRNFTEQSSYGMDDNILSDYYMRLSAKSVQTGAKIIKLFFDEIEYQENNNIPNTEPLTWWRDLTDRIRRFLGLNPIVIATKEAVMKSAFSDSANIDKNSDNVFQEPESAISFDSAPLSNDIANLTTAAVPLINPIFEEHNSNEGEIDTGFYIAALPLPLDDNYVAPVINEPDGVGGEDAEKTVATNTLAYMIQKYGHNFGGFYTEDNREGQNTENIENQDSGDGEEENQTLLLDDGGLNLENEEENTENDNDEDTNNAEENIDENEESGDNLGDNNENKEEIATAIPHLAITEVQTRGNGGAWDESVKIINNNSTSTSLLGFKLQSRSASTSTVKWVSRSGNGLPDININASGTVVLASKDYSGIDEVWRHTARWGFADEGGGVRLLNSKDEMVAEKYWGILDNGADADEDNEEIKDFGDGDDKGVEVADEEIIEEENDENKGDAENTENLEENVDEQREEDAEENLPREEEEFDDNQELEPGEETIVSRGPTILAGKISNETMILSKEFSPYLVSMEFFVDKNAALIIEPGVIIKFGKEFQSTWMKFPTHMRIAGSLYINGTIKNPVVFTSIIDDNFGGDTNGDGLATIPAPYDWGHLVIESGSDEEINISNAHFYYGGNNTGSNGNGAVLISRGGVEINVKNCYFANNPVAISNFGWKNTESKVINITNTLIENNKSGVILDVYAPISIKNSTIRSNSNYGIYLEAFSSDVLELENNNIYGNKKYGLWNFYGSGLKSRGLANTEVSARNNWWGDATGPAPEGVGDKAGGKVDYSDWLLEESAW